MLEGIVATNSISFIFVFLEGILSFFSPCIIPLIPVYMSYLAGNAKKEGEDGIVTYDRRKVFFHTLFFVLGISFAFFVLGMAVTTLGKYFYNNKMLFTRIGGILIVILGLFQLGIFNFSFLQKERKFRFNLGNKSVNPFLAFLMGFTFSFAWTPCVGPVLSSVLIMASGAKTAVLGNFLVFVYAIGFVLPFLLLGLFTAQILDFLKKKKNIIKYTIKIGGVILVLMGIMTFTGWMNGISSYLNSFTVKQQYQSETKKKQEEVNEDGSNKKPEQGENTQEDPTINDSIDNKYNGKDSVASDDRTTTDGNTSSNNESEAEDSSSTEFLPAYDFTLTDQYGNTHTLSDYKGKVVFLNFWATWCPPCQKEMPDIEELYQKYDLNEDEVVILGVANPKNEEYPNNADEEKEEIIAFLDEHGYTFPTVFDETGEILMNYYISAFPTTFMINKDGNVVGYIPGMMTKDIMESVIEQTKETTK